MVCLISQYASVCDTFTFLKFFFFFFPSFPPFCFPVDSQLKGWGYPESTDSYNQI